MELPVLSCWPFGLIAILLINCMELSEDVFVEELPLFAGAGACETLGFKVLQLVVSKTRVSMYNRFFNILCTFEDIGTDEDRQNF